MPIIAMSSTSSVQYLTQQGCAAAATKNEKMPSGTNDRPMLTRNFVFGILGNASAARLPQICYRYQVVL